MHVSFHFSELGIFFTVLSAAGLPALKLRAEPISRHNMLPLDSPSTLIRVSLFCDLSTRRIPTAARIRDTLLAYPVDAAATVKCCGIRVLLVGFNQLLFGTPEWLICQGIR